MKKLIRLKIALAEMNSLEKAFQISFVTYNDTTKKGGEIITLTKAFKVGAKYNLNDNDMIAVKQEGNSNHPYPVHIHLITEYNNQSIFI